MSMTILPEGEREITKRDVFLMIQKLSCNNLAEIYESSNSVTVVSFYSKGLEFICRWSFKKDFFESELESLFTKHNSVHRAGRKEQ